MSTSSPQLLQLARLCLRLGPQPAYSCYRDSTRLRPTHLFFTTSLRPQAHPYPAHQGSMPTRHCPSTSLCSPEWRSTRKRTTPDKQPLPSFPAHPRTPPRRSPQALSRFRQMCGSRSPAPPAIASSSGTACPTLRSCLQARPVFPSSSTSSPLRALPLAPVPVCVPLLVRAPAHPGSTASTLR